MINTIDIAIEHSPYLTEDGIEIYIGEQHEPAVILDMQDLTEDFLESICDVDGKAVINMVEELDTVIEKFKTCLKMLEDARQ